MASAAPLILIIEDDLPIRRFLQSALTAEGYRLNEAESGEKAIRRAHPGGVALNSRDWPVPTFDRRKTPSPLPERTCWPSGEKATPSTHPA